MKGKLRELTKKYTRGPPVYQQMLTMNQIDSEECRKLILKHKVYQLKRHVRVIMRKHRGGKRELPLEDSIGNLKKGKYRDHRRNGSTAIVGFSGRKGYMDIGRSSHSPKGHSNQESKYFHHEMQNSVEDLTGGKVQKGRRIFKGMNASIGSIRTRDIKDRCMAVIQDSKSVQNNIYRSSQRPNSRRTYKISKYNQGSVDRGENNASREGRRVLQKSVDKKGEDGGFMDALGALNYQGNKNKQIHINHKLPTVPKASARRKEGDVVNSTNPTYSTYKKRTKSQSPSANDDSLNYQINFKSSPHSRLPSRIQGKLLTTGREQRGEIEGLPKLPSKYKANGINSKLDSVKGFQSFPKTTQGDGLRTSPITMTHSKRELLDNINPYNFDAMARIYSGLGHPQPQHPSTVSGSRDKKISPIISGRGSLNRVWRGRQMNTQANQTETRPSVELQTMSGGAKISGGRLGSRGTGGSAHETRRKHLDSLPQNHIQTTEK